MRETSKTGTESIKETPVRSRARLVGIDAARGLALLGLMAIHLLPAWNEETGGVSWSWRLFSGDSAALFALLAGVGLALTSGGRNPHQGRRMTADRVGLLVRALLIAVVGLWLGTLMPADPPAYGILLYYGVFFLLAIPFLHMGPKVLFACAAVFGIVSPILMQNLVSELPAWSSYNPTFIDVLTEPGAVASQLLLTGTYPALPYMAYLLVGLGLGRLNLRETAVQVRVLVVGVGLTIFAYVTSSVLLYAFGGYQRLLSASGMSEYELDQILIWGPDSLPASTGWWLAITTPHTNTPLAIMASLGVSLIVLGVFLLIAPKVGKWLLPLSAMGAMTFTLYTAHLVALSIEVHYGQPYLWFVIHLVAAAVFAMLWQRSLGQGPLEKVVSTSVKGTRRLVSGAENQSRNVAGGRGSET
ncbi:heparan-alpha-glucosaminide N-acetyltransferase domain-containing protein [Nesterenkonia sandarakina]|uniref:heparan-alpha-glucosaminide N-acetyltransferase domain-containing protein n=1 Tax=Nesterenkonia sandarakina TaxID=272918 RepID=UPI00280B4182|nr:heparan-alpha-glucosaminide N-acetyltransferase domain-containing protein [Nesterenkonia sandarakina]